MFFHHLIVNCL